MSVNFVNNLHILNLARVLFELSMCLGESEFDK